MLKSNTQRSKVPVCLEFDLSLKVIKKKNPHQPTLISFHSKYRNFIGTPEKKRMSLSVKILEVESKSLRVPGSSPGGHMVQDLSNGS